MEETLTDVTAPAIQPTRRPRVTMKDIEALGEELDALNQSIRRVVNKGDRKLPPTFNATQLAAMCGKSPPQMLRLLDRSVEFDLADGVVEGAKGGAYASRKFSLAEARAWVKHLRGRLRPEGQRGATVTVANFKGGVGKTVVTMALAQGLSLKGYSVLAIDFDPQGSMTSLFDVTPADVQEEQTVLPLMMPVDDPRRRDSLHESIQTTYWDGIDLIPASHSLFSGEFYLPSRQMVAMGSKNSAEPDFRFWNVLNKALDEGLREHYDYIIIDTPPALSYMTMTCFWASDALLLPLPPEGIDFASSAQFWSMLSDLSTGMTGIEKEFAWVAAVPSKVDHAKLSTKLLLNWMKQGYKDLLMSVELPISAAVGSEAMRYSTVYDGKKYVGSTKTLARARESFDRLVDECDFLTRTNVWGLTA